MAETYAPPAFLLDWAPGVGGGAIPPFPGEVTREDAAAILEATRLAIAICLGDVDAVRAWARGAELRFVVRG